MKQSMIKLLSLVLALLMTVSPLSVCAEAFADEAEEPALVEEIPEEEVLPEEGPEEEIPEEIPEEPTEEPEEAPADPVPEETEAAEPAEDAEEIDELSEDEEEPVLTISGSFGDELPGNDELMMGFLYQEARGEDSITAMNVTPLTGIEAEVYENLSAFVSGIARNGGNVQKIRVNHTKGDVVFADVFHALLYNLPYDMYWFNKVKGWSCSYTSTYADFTFNVAQEYQSSSDAYVVDSSKAAAATRAANNAAAIVADAAGMGDYDKLDYYRQTICDLVSYNYTAAGTSGYPYGNPWQMIWVFDGDSSTNVVCEGYSKAFKYLCDLTEGWDADMEVHLATGTMDGGAHMWNIVTTGGKNYLVDVTNCDGDPAQNSYSIGYPDKLFLCGVSGSPTTSYKPTEVNTVYKYDSDMIPMYGTATLTLSSTPYKKPTGGTVSGTCGDGNTWRLNLDTGKLTVTGKGDIVNPSEDESPWEAYAKQISSVTIGSGITSISFGAFYECTNLTEITLPSSLKTIEALAFCRCTGLKSIVLPSTLTAIGDGAFYGCTTLTTVSIPASVTDLGTEIFANCSCLTGVTFSATSKLAQLPEGTFKNCTSLRTASLPNVVSVIGTDAFNGCSRLTKIVLPDNTKTIEEGAFYQCKALSLVEFSGSIEEIGQYAFSGCTALKDIRLSTSLITLGYCAFTDTGLTRVALPSSVETIGTPCFPDGTELVIDCLWGINPDAFANCTIVREHDVVTENAKAPTCTEDGFSDKTYCRKCNTVLTDSEPVSALGHSWNEGKVTTAAACEDEGVKTYTCTRCSETYTEAIPALGHNEVMDAAIPATCTEPGYNTVSHCGRCGMEMQKTDEVAALGHSWNEGKVTKAAKCETDGVMTYTCTRCKETYTEDIPALGHTPKHHPAVAADHGQAGNLEYWQCTVCTNYYWDEECTEQAKWADICIDPLGTLVVYELDGGENDPANPDEIEYGSTAKITLKDPVRTGYTFAGWYRDANFTLKAAAPQITPSIVQQSGGMLEFYAKWTANTYKLAFNANGGSGKMAALSAVSYGQNVKLTNTFAKKGYRFVGWNTAKNGTGDAYLDGETVSGLTAVKGATVTLYAQWEAEVYSIAYDLDGGTAPALTEEYTILNTVTMPTPVRPGYKFAGWYNQANKKVSKIAKGSIGDQVLTARWTANTYSIKYVLGGGKAAKGAISKYTYDVNYVLNAIPTKKGYAFTGWTLNGVPFNEIPAGTIGNLTLEAGWAMETYTIAYDLAGGMDVENAETYTILDAVTLNAPERPGYKFAGWYNGSKKVSKIAKGSAGDLALTAKWTAVSYTVKYNLNGGKVAKGNPAKYTYGSNLPMSVEPTKKGYAFTGWYLDADCTQKISGITPEMYGNLAVYAGWNIITYQIRFHDVETLGNSGNKTAYTVLDTVTLVAPDNALPGYAFAGWYNQAGKKVAKVAKGSIGDLELFPRWSVASYTVKYVLNGGTAPKGNPSGYKMGFTAVLKAPTRKGYTFGGWYKDAALTQPITEITPTTYGNLTLYAKWN